MKNRWRMLCGVLLLILANLNAQDTETSSADTAGIGTTDGELPSSDTESSAMSSSLPTDDAPTGIASPKAPGDIMNFQTDLFTGRFTYQVPIVVPPGRGNSQPNLGLLYSSSGGNGWCGVGLDI